jgi:hypothetical protein
MDARYTYDGNGTLFKRVVNGITTYYPSASYQDEKGGHMPY